jgi:hypothetical protein
LLFFSHLLRVCNLLRGSALSVLLQAYQVPPSGSLVRQFHCVDLSRDGLFVYVGTGAGEMMVYRRDTLVFRACIPVCTNGLQDLVTLRDDSVLCGGGDGAFVRVLGRDMSWQCADQVQCCTICDRCVIIYMIVCDRSATHGYE